MSPDVWRPPREALVGPGQIECHAVDMTATVSADVPLESAQRALAKFDQWIPIDGEPSVPVGQLVAENSTGPLRLGYGGWRDLLLGCQFRIKGEKLITAGGQTMKNVAGYDLTKFMVGQYGQFGALVTITLRTYKRPGGVLVGEFPASEGWVGKIITSPLRPRYAIIRPNQLLCGWLDDERSLNYFQRLAADYSPRKLLRRSLDEDIADRARLWNLSGDHFRASVPPARVVEFAQSARVPDWTADAAFGVVIGPCKEIDSISLRKCAAEAGGSVTFFGRDRLPQWEPTAAEMAVLNALGNALAPDG